MTAITITIANQKGGVGKTTTAVTLAHGLALKNQNVLLVDLDPQGQCSSHLGLPQDPGVYRLLANQPRPPLSDVVCTTNRPRLWLLPGNKSTTVAQTLLALNNSGIDTIARILTEVPRQVNYVIIDTAPSAGGLQECALYACHLLLIPSAVDHLSLEGVREVLNTLKATNRPKPPIIRVLPTFHNKTTTEASINLAKLNELFKTRLLDPIHTATRLRECPALASTIWEHAPKSRAASEYATLIWKIMEVFNV